MGTSADPSPGNGKLLNCSNSIFHGLFNLYLVAYELCEAKLPPVAEIWIVQFLCDIEIKQCSVNYSVEYDNVIFWHILNDKLQVTNHYKKLK